MGADVAVLGVPRILRNIGIKLLEINDIPCSRQPTSVKSSPAPRPPPPPPGPHSFLTSQSPLSRRQPLCHGYRFGA